MPGSSSATIRTAKNQRKEEQKILTVTTYQMCLLMRFNLHSKMTFEVFFYYLGIKDDKNKNDIMVRSYGVIIMEKIKIFLPNYHKGIDLTKKLLRLLEES
jgi:hypothetical protein